MLRFRLGPIPVQVHPSHFLVAAVLGMRAGTPSTRELVQDVVSWVFVVFVSVLVHELGHAVAALAFGYRPDIQLVWLGGLTRPNAPGPIPWRRDVLVTLAGPVAGGALGLLCWVAARFVPGPAWLDSLLVTFVQTNLFWAVLNMLPVPPLDGGHIVVAILRRFFGGKGELAALAFGCAVGLGLALVLGRQGWLSLAVLLGFLGFQCGTLFATRRRNLSSGSAADQALTHSQSLLSAGNLDEAKTLAEQVLLQESDGIPRARAQRLLGWIALKRGEGRVALDHFSQVQRVRVEPQALAAAFSLVGDEGRALPLWESAHQESPNDTVLHEWAGALIRAGQTERALALPGVKPVYAYGCAERVLFLRGDFEGSARLGEEALRIAPQAGTAYDAACAYARAGKVDDALRLLHRAIALGFDDFAHLASDSDLDSLHTHPDWKTLRLGGPRESLAC